MKTMMKLEDLTTIDQLTEFLSGTQTVVFSVISDKDACYRWIQGELVKFRYLRLSRQGKGGCNKFCVLSHHSHRRESWQDVRKPNLRSQTN